MLLFYIWKVADLLSGSLEFFKETGIVLWEQAEVGDAILQVGYALDIHAEGVAAVLFGVDVA